MVQRGRAPVAWGKAGRSRDAVKSGIQFPLGADAAACRPCRDENPCPRPTRTRAVRRPKNGFTYPQLNRDILAVAEAAGFARSVVVGFSGGCKNAVWLAVEQPDRVLGLVLVAPPGLSTVPLPPDMVAKVFDSLEHDGDLPGDFDPWFTGKIGARRADVIGAMAATPRAVLEASAELWIHTSVVEQASRTTHPIVVVAGAREPVYHPEFQRQTTLATLPHAKMELFDCAHFIPCEEPGSLATLVSRFLAMLGSRQT
ncbi:MAG: alpha/beta fold hydrolase [Opitutaceae bacterium]